LCRSLRRADDYTVPVILLTALGEEDDRIAGLEAGADDYLTKPFSPRELALRVRSVLRRAPAVTGPQPGRIVVGDLTVLPAARSATVGDRPLSLTNREFDLLVFLLTHTDTVFSREELLKLVWRWDFGDLSTVTVHVKRLRAKLGDQQHRLQTVWGRGYLWSSSSREEQT
jgi:DNA-binding response OmpR family regulator